MRSEIDILIDARARCAAGTDILSAIHEAATPGQTGCAYPTALTERLFGRLLGHLAYKHRVCHTNQTCIAIWSIRHHRTQQDSVDLIDKALANAGTMPEAKHDRHKDYVARQAALFPF